MVSNNDLNLKPRDRLVVDWCEENGHFYHVAVDVARGFLWACEFRLKGTKESLEHLEDITNIIGHYVECHSCSWGV